MDSTLELLNYAPGIYIDEEKDEVFIEPVEGPKEAQRKNSELSRGKTKVQSPPDEESGFQEEEEEPREYPDPDDPFDAWFSSESDMLILYEMFGEFYDEEFEKLGYEEKKEVKDKVLVSEPKSAEELLELYPEEEIESSFISASSFTYSRPNPSHRDTEETRDLLERFSISAPEEEIRKNFGDWFEPMEELILFDILGIDYRDLFEEMTLEEKRELRKRVDNTEPKSKEELLAMLSDEESENEEELQVSRVEDSFDSPKLNRKEKSRRLTLLAQNPERVLERKEGTPGKVYPQEYVFKTPSNRRNYEGATPSYLKPTSASVRGEHSPMSSEKFHCPRYFETKSVSPHFGSSPKQSSYRRPPTGIDLSKVVSPVAQYIHSNPVPSLIRNIKPSPKHSKRVIAEVTKETQSLQPSCCRLNDKNFTPLPEANYKPSRLITEQEVESKVKTLPMSSFPSSETLEPKIFRHLGRVKVPRSIQLRENGTENLENIIPSTPGSSCKVTLKKNVRDSIAPPSNESMIDMSVHEIKAVQKLSKFKV